jgi:hypothetical protein
LYRREGLLGQAGRWSYLSEQVDPLELSAFEREYPDPVHRMRALGWRAAEDAGGELARQRLMALRVDAEKASGRTLSWEKSEMRAQPRKTWGDWVFDVVVIVVFGLLLLGGIAFVVQGFQVVLRWFGH